LTTVALDLLGGDGGPAVIAAAARLALESDPDIRIVLVGPTGIAESAALTIMSDGIPRESVQIVESSRAIAMDEDPLPAVRSAENVTVVAGVRAVRQHVADAFVTAGHTGAAVAASVFGYGRIHASVKPALAVVLPAERGPVVLLDAGASTDATAQALLGHAISGAAYATALGLEAPCVGLLSIGSEAGKGDTLRAAAQQLMTENLSAAGINFAGLVEGHDVALGERANVIVTDGFTGNVVLKTLEGAVRWAAHRMAEEYSDPKPARAVVARTARGDFAGGTLLGVQGLTVVGHGAGTAEEISACILLAARASRNRLVPAITTSTREVFERAGV
jgi:glycerol-3-phosphate acyltransferase PlsX